MKINRALTYYYFTLATIHDKMRGGYIPIHNDKWAKQLAKTCVWSIIEKLCVDRRFIIETALDHEEADLAEKSAETDERQGKIVFLHELTPEEPSEY